MKIITKILFLLFTTTLSVNGFQPAPTRPAPVLPDSVDTLKPPQPVLLPEKINPMLLFQTENQQLEIPEKLEQKHFHHRRHMKHYIREKLDELVEIRFDKRETIDGQSRLFSEFVESINLNETINNFRSLFNGPAIIIVLAVPSDEWTGKQIIYVHKSIEFGHFPVFLNIGNVKGIEESLLITGLFFNDAISAKMKSDNDLKSESLLVLYQITDQKISIDKTEILRINF